MSREEIIAKWDSLTPRERDAWVAEAVMGYSAIKIDGNTFIILDDKSLPVDFNPSEDISAAWEIVEKIIQDEMWINLIVGKDTDCTIFSKGKICGEVMGEAKKETAPEVICLAALIAKEVTSCEQK